MNNIYKYKYQWSSVNIYISGLRKHKPLIDKADNYVLIRLVCFVVDFDYFVIQMCFNVQYVEIWLFTPLQKHCIFW